MSDLLGPEHFYIKTDGNAVNTNGSAYGTAEFNGISFKAAV